MPDRPDLGWKADIRVVRDWLNAVQFLKSGRVDEPLDRDGRQLRKLFRKDSAFNAYASRHMIDNCVSES